MSNKKKIKNTYIKIKLQFHYFEGKNSAIDKIFKEEC